MIYLGEAAFSTTTKYHTFWQDERTVDYFIGRNRFGLQYVLGHLRHLDCFLGVRECVAPRWSWTWLHTSLYMFPVTNICMFN